MTTDVLPVPVAGDVSAAEIPVARPAIALTSRRTFAGAVTALAVIALSAALAIALAAGMHLPAPRDDGDVIGWITLHHYSKVQEQINFFGSMAIVIVIGRFAFGLLRRFAEAFELRGASPDTALFVASLAYLPGSAVFLVGLQRTSLFTHPLTYAAAIAGAILVGHAVVWNVLRRRRFAPSAAVAAVPLAVSPPATTAVHRTLSILVVVLTGAFCGWFLPNFFWFAPGLAHALAAIGGLVPFVAVALYLWLSMKSDRAILAFLPAAALVLVPFVELRPVALVVLGLLVAAATWYVVAGLLRDRERFRRLSVTELAVWLAVLGACIHPAYYLSVNPNIAHGQNVGAVDGDNELAWLNDAVRGRFPYRNFSYPYGPLEFFAQYLPAKLFGLDRFGTPFASSEAVADFLGAAFASAIVFLRPLGAIVAAPILFVLYGFGMRIWLPMTAFVGVLRAYALGTRSAAVLAGVLYGFGTLAAPEFIVIASVAAVILGGIAWLDLRRTIDRERVLRVTGWIAAGAAVVLVPAAAYLAARGMLIPYLQEFVSFIGVVDRCCGEPYAPLVDAGGLVGGPGTGLLWVLKLPLFRTYYLAPAIYGIGFAYLIARRAVGGRLALKDYYLLGITIFGTLLFRNALGRSDEGHVAYSTLQAGFVALLLMERAILAGWAAAVALARERTRSLAGAAASFGVLVGAIAGVAITARAVDAWTPTMHRFDDVSRGMRTSYTAEITPPPDRVAATSGWRAVPGPRGEQFLFRDPPAGDMIQVLDYLRGHLKPGEAVYAMPYASRYEFMLGLTTPIDLGPEMWSVATRKRYRDELVSQLRAAKPHYIVYDETEWPDADGVSWLDRYPEVARFLFTDYHVETLIGRTVIFAYGAKSDVPDQLRLADLYRMPNLLSGWYYPQGVDGRDARWMTTDAELRLTRRSDERALSLQVLGSGAQARTLTVTIDGRALPPIPLAGSDQWRVVHEPVPPGTPSGRPLSIRLHVDTPVNPPLSNRIQGAAIAWIGFVTPAQLRTADLDALHAVATAPPRASLEVQSVNDRGPAPSVAYRGSIALPSGTTVDEIFAAFDAAVPARASQVRRSGDAVAFSGTMPLNDVSPGRHVVTLRAVSVTAAGDTFKADPVAQYEQIVDVPSPPRIAGSVPAVRAFDRRDRFDVDLIRTQDGSAPLPSSGPVLLARGYGMTISGWAIGPNGRPFSGMLAIVDGRGAWPVTYGVARPDVVAKGFPNARLSGFYARLPAAALPQGDHQVTLAALEPGGARFLRGIAVHVAPMGQSYYIDAVNGTPFKVGDPHATVVARRDEPLSVVGWAVDGQHVRPYAGVQLFLDGRYLATAKYGINRPDVAGALKNPAYGPSGFEAHASLENVRPGAHELRLAFRGQDGTLSLEERSVRLVVK